MSCSPSRPPRELVERRLRELQRAGRISASVADSLLASQDAKSAEACSKTSSERSSVAGGGGTMMGT